jgi:hypothetical protein
MFPLDAVLAHRDRVANRNRDDLIAALAGLQLVPQNADRLLRLEGGVQTVASLDGVPARRVTRSELDAWLAATPFAVGEDPFNNSFVEELPFVGGSYRVLPGLMDGSAYLVRRLAAAIFLSEEFDARSDFEFPIWRRVPLDRNALPEGKPPWVLEVVVDRDVMSLLILVYRPDLVRPRVECAVASIHGEFEVHIESQRVCEIFRVR